MFKVLEYKAVATDKLSLGAIIGAPVDAKYVPIHESQIDMTEALRLRLAEGTSNVAARIEGAGQRR